jgi:phosphatidylserine synthase
LFQDEVDNVTRFIVFAAGADDLDGAVAKAVPTVLSAGTGAGR